MPSNVQQVLLSYGGSRPDASISFLQTNSDAVDRTTYTFTDEPIGAEDSARYVLVGFTGRRSTAVAAVLNSATIGGNAATIVGQQQGGSDALSGLILLAVPSGTTSTITLTFNGTMARCGIMVYRVLNINPTAEDTGVSNANPLTDSLVVSAGSIQIAVAGTLATTTATWSGTNGATEDSDTTQDGTNHRMSSASRTSPAALTVTTTCTWGSSFAPSLFSASFAKA